MTTIAQDHSPRNQSRFLASLPTELHLESGDHPCHAFNLSRSGVLLVGALPLPDTPVVRLTIRSGCGDLMLTCSARIVRSERDPAGEEHQLGVEFVDVAGSEQETLEALVSRVVEGVAPAALSSLSKSSSPVEIRKVLESISLAHRIVLAGRGMPREREMLIHDPAPQVIDALARNPNLLPPEARMILRMPGLLPHTLEALARDPKWRGDEAILLMIATHHNVPLQLADRLISGFSPEGVRKALQSSGLKAPLREKLVRKQPGGRR